MNIIAMSDLHARTAVIPMLAEPLRNADLVLLCGDITHFGHAREMQQIVQQIRAFNTTVYAVTGNCDHTGAERYLADEGLSLAARVLEVGGYQLAGLNGSLPCPGRTPQEYSEEEYAAILDHIGLISHKPLIFVTHQPPYGTLNDQVSPGRHVGSKIIRSFIEKQQPLICFTGHIHEGIAIDTLGATTIVNPGPAGAGNYAMAEIEGNTIKNLQLRNLFQR